MKYLVQITLMAVISEEDVMGDRLNVDGSGCPLNILPKLVEAAVTFGDGTDTCPFCGGRATAKVLRVATRDDEERYAWPTDWVEAPQ